MTLRALWLLALLGAGSLLLVAASPVHAQPTDLGPFDESAALGTVDVPGEAAYDPSAQVLRLEGGGTGLGGTADALYGAWTRVGGDVLLRARAERLDGEGKAPGRSGGQSARAGPPTRRT